MTTIEPHLTSATLSIATGKPMTLTVWEREDGRWQASIVKRDPDTLKIKSTTHHLFDVSVQTPQTALEKACALAGVPYIAPVLNK